MKLFPFLAPTCVGLALAVSGHAQTNAPTANLANTYFTGTIAGATGGANGDGTIMDFFSASGLDYSVSAAGAFSNPVPYTYASTGANTGTLTEGSLVVTLTFTSATGGTFLATYSSGVTQTGTFSTNTAGFAAPISDVSSLFSLAAGTTFETGFVIGGGVPRTVLIRAVGAGLGTFGLKGTLGSPQLTLWTSGSASPMQTGGSTTAAMQSVYAAAGAFTLPVGSSDQTIVATLNPGPYTAMVKGGSASDSGTVLVEVYFLN